MHVAQVTWVIDALRRSPEELLAAWPTLSDVARAANADGVRVTVVQPGHRDAILERGDVAFHFVAVPGAAQLDRDSDAMRSGRASPRLRRGIRVRAAVAHAIARRAAMLQPDVLHVHGLGFPGETRWLARVLPRAPILVQDHGSRLPPRRKRPLCRWGLSRIAGVAFTARSQVAPFLAAHLLRPDLPVFEVLESSSRFTPADPPGARARTGIDGDPCLLWIGRLNANKDPLTVIEALARAMPNLPDARLWCCYTDAPLLDAVRARLAADPALASRVRLLGPVPHETVQDLLRAADFLVLGSHREGSGYALLEALACGTTPLVTDIPSFRRITSNGAVGALSPPGDADAMARALIEWAGRDRSGLRRAARAHFERALSFDALGAELRDAYRALGAGIPGPTRREQP